MSKTEPSSFPKSSKNLSLKKGRLYIIVGLANSGALFIRRDTDVKIKLFLLTKDGKSTWKSKKYHQINWGFFSKSQTYFFLFSIQWTKKINLQTNPKVYSVVIRWANYMSLILKTNVNFAIGLNGSQNLSLI